MSFADGKVLLFRLYERQSKSGNLYLGGRLGSAKVIAFLDTEAERQFGATTCFDIYLQSGEERKADSGAPGVPGSQPRSSSGSAAPPGRVQRWQRRKAEKPPADRPFYDDAISDVGQPR